MYEFLSACVCVCATCVYGDNMRALEILRAGVINICKPSRECEEPNLSPLQEQLVLLTTNNRLSASAEYCHPGQEEKTQTGDAQWRMVGVRREES